MKSLLRNIMENEGVTIRKLEDSTGLAHVTILNARSNEKILNCKLSTLEIIAHALGCRVKDLFSEGDDPSEYGKFG